MVDLNLDPCTSENRPNILTVGICKTSRDLPWGDYNLGKDPTGDLLSSNTTVGKKENILQNIEGFPRGFQEQANMATNGTGTR